MSGFSDDDHGTLAMLEHQEQAEPRRHENIIRDFAIRAWGELRGIDKMNSHKAIGIIQQAMLDAVAATRGKEAGVEKDLGQVKRAGRALRAAVMKLWGQKGDGTDPSKGSQKFCRLCGGTRSGHAKGCQVAQALAQAQAAGIGD